MEDPDPDLEPNLSTDAQIRFGGVKNLKGNGTYEQMVVERPDV